MKVKMQNYSARRWEKQVQPVWGWFPGPSHLELHLHSHESTRGEGTGRCNALCMVALQQGCVTSLLPWLGLFPSPWHGVSSRELQSKPAGQSFIPKLWIIAALPRHTGGKRSERRQSPHRAQAQNLGEPMALVRAARELSVASVGQRREYPRRDCIGKWGKQESNCQ